MLCVTLRKGWSLKAEGHFELFYDGTDEFGDPIFGLQVKDQAYIDRLDVSYDSELRIGETRIDMRKTRAHRVRLAIEAPQHIRFSWPSSAASLETAELENAAK